jgi:alkanesulfonate monooxygenase SsuD/methylene tetrahydromethanopterin reductase-like flavin-dependent oxidoreductase (luciferase family)
MSLRRPRTSGLGTAIITLPLELPIRVAEDASVLDIVPGCTGDGW